MTRRLVLGLAALAVIGGAALFIYLSEVSEDVHSPNPAFSEPLRPLPVGDVTLRVAVADTSEERILGLSGTKTLDQGTGLLFVFESDTRSGFWMKDMLFPIDIIWISATGEVVGVEADVSPDTYPAIFSPTEKIRYVLEVPAGFSTAHNIEKSTKISVETAL